MVLVTYNFVYAHAVGETVNNVFSRRTERSARIV